ncbi:MAG: hypothetical protein RJQ09_10675 [Cyclobacteriaceae bacterium]
MDKIGDIEVYLDDIEIIEYLKSVPVLEDQDNKSILRLIEESQGSDFGTVFGWSDVLIVIYKFDNKFYSEEDSGLVMTISSRKDAMEQKQMWEQFWNQGMMKSEKIYKSLVDLLVANHAVYLMHSNQESK